MQAGAGQPLVSPRGQVHREVDVRAQCSESRCMETPYGGYVSSHRTDSQVLVTTGTSLFDDPADEHPANPVIPSRLSDNDRLDFSTLPVIEQTSQANDGAARIGNPGAHPLRRGEVVIQACSRIVPANRRVPIEGSVIPR